MRAVHRPWALVVVFLMSAAIAVEPAAPPPRSGPPKPAAAATTAATRAPSPAPCPPPPFPRTLPISRAISPSPTATRAPVPPTETEANSPSPSPLPPKPSLKPPSPSPSPSPSPPPPAPPCRMAEYKSPPPLPPSLKASPPPPLNPANSRLWGATGELWDPQGPLSDWSWAGYHQGQDVPPSPPATLSLKLNYGAVGDGIADDTAAFARAFAEAPSGAVLFIPRGTYLLTGPVTRYNPLVLRGAGRDQSIIKMNQSFTAVWPGSWDFTNTTAQSPYSDGPCFMSFMPQPHQLINQLLLSGDDLLQSELGLGLLAQPLLTRLPGAMGFRNIMEATRLGDIIMDAKKGDTLIQVVLSRPNATLIQPGDMIRITSSDVELSLINYMNGGIQMDARITNNQIKNTKQTYQFLSPVKSVGVLSTGTKTMTVQVELSRPLALDLMPSIWRDTQMHRGLEYTMFESGVEDLSFVFPPSQYSGHSKERGYNAFLMNGCSNCWMRRLAFTNADIGLDLQLSAFTTVDDIHFNGLERLGKRMPVGYGAGWLSAHHHIRMARDQDCRAQNILINAAGVHDITWDRYATLNVYHNIISPDLSLDFHGCVPTANLVSNCSCGACTRVWSAGRAQDVGAHAGLLNTVWGMRGSGTNTFTAAPVLFGSNMTYVGVNLADRPTYDNVVVDMVMPRLLMPQDLAAAMLVRRLAAVVATRMSSLLA